MPDIDVKVLHLDRTRLLGLARARAKSIGIKPSPIGSLVQSPHEPSPSLNPIVENFRNLTHVEDGEFKKEPITLSIYFLFLVEKCTRNIVFDN